MKVKTKKQYQKAQERLFELILVEDTTEFDVIIEAMQKYDEQKANRLPWWAGFVWVGAVLLGMTIVFIKTEVTGAEDNIIEGILSLARFAGMVLFLIF